MPARYALVLALALAAAPLGGCLGFGKKSEAAQNDVNQASRDITGNRTQELIESRVALVPKNYTFADQRLIPWTTVYFNDSFDPTANTAFEDRNDRGGNAYKKIVKKTDLSQYVPPGQPVEIRLTLSYAGTLGSSADLDIWVNVPGNSTSWAPDNGDEFNWKFSVERRVVNTIGVPGLPMEVGVEAANGKILGGSVAFTLRMELNFVKDVVTPYHPWAFQVPRNASGVIFQSVKAGGPEHIKSQFIVVSPTDDLVAFVDFNDIAIPTESVFVPTPVPGEYVFYAYYMNGGFLEMRADVGVDDRVVRPLAQKEEKVAEKSGAAPGFAERDWLHDGTLVTPAEGGETLTFTVDKSFPLRVTPFIFGESGGSTLMSEVLVSSAKGSVAKLQRVLRHDDEHGSLGYTQDEWNREFHPANLAKGNYEAKITNDSPDALVGVNLLSYER